MRVVMADDNTPKIAKYLAQAGVASRREAERLVLAGYVKRNGKALLNPAERVQPTDTITCQGKAVKPAEKVRLWCYHKPRGQLVTRHDPEGRPTIFDYLPTDMPYCMAIGRLDFTSEGLLLLTNNGDLARQLELPSTGWKRTYRVRVHGVVDDEALQPLRDGLQLASIQYQPAEIILEKQMRQNCWLQVSLREGKNREIRNMFGALGFDVSRLIRISYGAFHLGKQPEGTLVEVKRPVLRAAIGIERMKQLES